MSNRSVDLWRTGEAVPMTPPALPRAQRPPRRRRRPFDPSQSVGSFTSGDQRTSPEETLALQEKLTRGHHRILVVVHQFLTGGAWTSTKKSRLPWIFGRFDQVAPASSLRRRPSPLTTKHADVEWGSRSSWNTDSSTAGRRMNCASSWTDRSAMRG